MAQYYVYIMASHSRVLYVGVTNDLQRRIFEHRTPTYASFTSRYKVNRLVHYEVYSDPETAIDREKQLKNWRREKKIALIEETNPTWSDRANLILADTLAIPF